VAIADADHGVRDRNVVVDNEADAPVQADEHQGAEKQRDAQRVGEQDAHETTA
jgi:hypothetical protein